MIIVVLYLCQKVSEFASSRASLALTEDTAPVVCPCSAPLDFFVLRPLQSLFQYLAPLEPPIPSLEAYLPLPVRLAQHRPINPVLGSLGAFPAPLTLQYRLRFLTKLNLIFRRPGVGRGATRSASLCARPPLCAAQTCPIARAGPRAFCWCIWRFPRLSAPRAGLIRHTKWPRVDVASGIIIITLIAAISRLARATGGG